MRGGLVPSPTAAGPGVRRVIGVLLLAIAGIGLLAPLPVFAQQGGESIATTLRYEDPASGDRVPVAGAALEVDLDGQQVASGATDADGVFQVEVPGPGRYTLTLDPSTLPEGVQLRDPDRVTVDVEVLQGQTARGIFALISSELAGTVDEGGGTSLRSVLQLTTEGIKLGLFLGMAAIGLSLIYGTTGLVNFAHGEMIVWGMLVAYFFNFFGLAGMFGFMADWPAPFGAGINLIPATLIAIVFGGFAGWALDKYIFGPLRRRGVSLIAAMVVSIGLSILFRYIFLFIFRGTPRFFKDYTAQSALDIGLVQITPKDLVTVVLSLLVLGGVGLFLQTTKLGKAMRAVSDNRDLAESSGIDVQRVIRFVWIAGGSLAALGGVFIGLAEQVSWNIGFRILLLIFAGVVLGGLGTAYGALVGSLIVGVGIQVSTLFIPTELKNVGALAVLIVALVIRPQGILGKRERIG